MGTFRTPHREPRNASWYNFPWKALSIASRLRTRWGRPETPRTWRRIVEYLHRSGFPAFDAEKLRLAVLDFDDRAEPRNDPHPVQFRSSEEEQSPASIESSSPPADPVQPKTREDVDASWKEAWGQEFPDEPWPGIEKAIVLLQRKARPRRTRSS
jgi:hypothetical protein